ncbi:MAG: hypothetical protein HN742_41770 [Lentisphaerae bacterium]|jgi:hypothetical protein|nr:hypothetical protein [Lentisphaerota bacterium]MBT4815271.1 hypothetical protein [Lentisphaerota bacterium]MBT5611697.1 hypothetical protein [Lentisphaerota bacterium]MBT7061165.1 hypothetical protein [Lentisphaerota bacterium]MBT7848466.1 hypothetical protein [Lentisphaerota bacterium]
MAQNADGTTRTIRHMWACGRPDPAKPGAGFPVLQSAKHTLIYQATRETGAYSHHSRLFRHDGALYAMWSNHRYGEDGPGQRVLWSRSTDGEDWTGWQELFPSPVPMVPSDEPGLVLTAGGWRVVGKRLFAVASVTAVVAFENSDRTSTVAKPDRNHPFRKREGRTRLAREVHPEGTLGPVFMLGRNLPEAADLLYPVLKHDTPQVTDLVRAILKQNIRRRFPQGVDSNRLCEFSVYQAKDGRHVLLGRDDCYSHRLYVSFSDDGLTWPPAIPTDIPDSPSLSRTLVLDNGTVLLIGNQMAPEFDNSAKRRHYGRDPLMISVSTDGYIFRRAYALRCGQQPWRVPRKDVKGRGGGGQYPDAVVHGDTLYVLYSMGKEDVWISRVALAGLDLRTRNTQTADAALLEKAAETHDVLWREFICPQTWQVCTYLDAKTRQIAFPSAEAIRALRPNTGGWGTAIENCSLDGGAYLGALVDRHAVTGLDEHAQEARKIYRGLRLIAKSARRKGIIIRGVLPGSGTHYPESSVDQYTMYVYGMWRYYRSVIPTDTEKTEIRGIFSDVLTRLEADRFVILSDAGERIKFGALDAWRPSRAERLLAIVLAGADITGDPHWRKVYEQLREPRLEHCRGRGGEAWVLVQNQLAFFILRRIETDPEIRKIYESGSIEAARECATFFDENRKSIASREANQLEGSLAIALSGDKELIEKHLQDMRRVMLKLDLTARGINSIRALECTVWSLRRQGFLAEPLP